VNLDICQTGLITSGSWYLTEIKLGCSSFFSVVQENTSLLKIPQKGGGDAKMT